MKKIVLLFTTLILSCALFAQNKTSVMPVLTYQTTQLEELKSSSYGGGLIFNNLWTSDENPLDMKSFTVQFTYLLDNLKAKAVLDENKMFFHQMSLNGMYHSGKHDLAVFASASGNKPFSSMKGLSLGTTYIYHIFDNQKWAFNIGGGLFFTQIQIGNVTIPVIPLPIFSASYTNSFLTSSLSFMGAPSLSISLFNKSPLRFSAAVQMAGFTSISDLSGHASIRYYFLPEHPLLKILNVQLGVERTVKSYLITNEKNDVNSYGASNWGIYGAFDASVLTIKAGYLFEGNQKYNLKDAGKTGQGWYCSIQGIIPF